MRRHTGYWGIVLLIGLAAVGKDVYVLDTPDYFPPTVYELESQPLTADKILLGRALFYDPVLSADGTISCASCHSPFNAFAHTDHELSHGIHDSIGTRNAPALFNLAWQSSFMWDGAINHLDMQALAPISHPGEMGETLANVVDKLAQKALYTDLFQRAFGDSVVSGQRVLKALSQFQISLVSAGSKYDQMRAGEARFTEQEEAGYTLFKTHCNSCHTEPLFSSYTYANNGLAVDTFLQDAGRFRISQNPSDSLLFKIPSLRNLRYTYPYMHDGRFRKLREVLDHYSVGIEPSPTLDARLSQSLALTSREQTDLIAFLLTLDDPDFVFDPGHRYPLHILQQTPKAE